MKELNTVEQYTSNATVNVEVQNLNDNEPIFDKSSYVFEVVENIAVGKVIGYVKVEKKYIYFDYKRVFVVYE